MLGDRLGVGALRRRPGPPGIEYPGGGDLLHAGHRELDPAGRDRDAERPPQPARSAGSSQTSASAAASTPVGSPPPARMARQAESPVPGRRPPGARSLAAPYPRGQQDDRVASPCVPRAGATRLSPEQAAPSRWPPSPAEPLAAFTPGIAFTGFNLVLTAVQWTSITPSDESLDYWWQGTTFTNFNFQQVSSTTGPDEFSPASIVSTHSASSPGEVAIVAPFTTNKYQTTGLDDWTQPTGGRAGRCTSSRRPDQRPDPAAWRKASEGLAPRRRRAQDLDYPGAG